MNKTEGKAKSSTTDSKGSQKSYSLSAIHAVMGVFFILCAYVNLNDPDGPIWVGLYLLSMAISFIASLNLINQLPRIPLVIPSIILLISVGWGAYLFQGLTIPHNTWEFFETEEGHHFSHVLKFEGREIGGLGMLALEMFLIIATFTFAGNQGKSGSSSFAITFVYYVMLGLVLAGFYATFFLQPAMNKKMQVPHCKGSIFGEEAYH